MEISKSSSPHISTSSGHDGPSPVDPEGFESLRAALEMAFDQAARGKGVARHGGQRCFSQQPMQTLIDLYGLGFAFGQAGKKCEESQRLPREKAITEIAGAIVYLAGAIVYLNKQRNEIA